VEVFRIETAPAHIELVKHFTCCIQLNDNKHDQNSNYFADASSADMTTRKDRDSNG